MSCSSLKVVSISPVHKNENPATRQVRGSKAIKIPNFAYLVAEIKFLFGDEGLI